MVFLVATFYDPIQQKYLSSELVVSKIDKLQACSDYHITLKLDLIGANVAFWTASTVNLPITIKFDNVSADLLGSTSTKPTDPATPGAPNALVFPTKAGTYQYQAFSKDGCSWAGEVVVVDGQFTTIQLETCKRALVAFYFNTFSNVPLAKQSIDIFVDNNPKSVGTLKAAYTGATLSNSCPSAPSTDNVLYIYLEPGVAHSYKAVSPPGVNGIPCVWSGSTSVLSTDCNLNLPVYINQGCL